MPLVKKPGRKIWHYQVKLNGRTWCHSTGETSRRRAEVKAAELKRLADTLRKRPAGCLQLMRAIIEEVARVKIEVSESEGWRLEYCLLNFYKHVGRDIPLEKVDARMLDEYQLKRLQEVALSTVNRELCGLTRMLRRNGFNIPKPVARCGRKTKHRPFTDDELVRFFSHCNPAQWLLFKIMLVTGARPAELVPSARSKHKALLKEDLDPQNCIITIRAAKLKAGQDETVRRFRIDGELMKRLVQYAKSITGPYVFPARSGSLHTTFDRILADANIPKVDARGRKLTAHSFRHTFATRMAQAEGNIFSVQQALGHTKPTTTSIYCHGSQTPVIVDISEVKGIRDGCTGKTPGSHRDLANTVFSMVSN